MRTNFRKSSRHSKITGDFGEALVLYWLSKHGYECARVDHTGIDIIARHPKSGELLGISVKSRSRAPGTEGTEVSVPKENFEKAKQACRAFGCVPYFAFIIDAGRTTRAYLLPLRHVLKLCPRNKRVVSWGMSERHLARYYADPEVTVIELYNARGW
ncbi:MAG: hypothetical protein LAO51_19755, partial [Acidobacteriia bacterium]|nr:hypothetical protein [Terriglobia bacterium]